MKVFGYDDTGVSRGELLAAVVRAIDLDFGMDLLAKELGWEYVFTSFKKAQSDLIARMKLHGIDPDLIKTVRDTKASYVPVTVELE